MALLDAIYDNEAKALQLIKNSNFPVNKLSSALIAACCMKMETVAIALIEKKANVDSQDDNGDSPLILASKYNLNKICKSLIKNKANVNLHCNDSFDKKTALMFACSEDNREIAELLIDQGAELDYKDYSGNTALMHCVNYYYYYEVPGQYDNGGWLAIMEKIIEKGSDINLQNARGMTVLHWAVSVQRIDMMEKLIKAGANLELKSKGYTVLHQAVNDNLVDIAYKLIDAKADVNSISGHDGIFITNNKKGSFVDFSILMSACKTNNVELINKLIKHGANVNYQTYDGITVLMIACLQPNDSVKILLDNGADINVNSELFGTALLICCSYPKNENWVIELINHGADFNLTDHHKISPIDKMKENKLTNAIKQVHKVYSSLFMDTITSADTIIANCFEKSNGDLNLIDLIVYFIV